MNQRIRHSLLAILLNICIFNHLYAMDIAITVDDIPANGDLPTTQKRYQISKKMLSVFEKHNISGVYGLINGKTAKMNNTNYRILQDWISQGQVLGNHTYSHLDLAKVSSDEFITDIKKNEPILQHTMEKRDFHYFRYPYLSEGNTQEKRDSVRHFLYSNNYKIAPVTVDFFEYEWNTPYVRCLAKDDYKSIQWLKKTYIEQALNAITISHALSMLLYGRDIKNISIIHINAFTTDMLDELLTAYETNGVRFISLEDALTDKVYAYNPNIVRDRAYTFLNQVRLSKNLKNPEIVDELYASLPEEKLNTLCN